MRRNLRISPWLLLVLLQLFAGASSHAAITVVSYWRLGENDPGAAPGVTATNTVDIAGANNLTVHGAARYTNDVAATAANHTGSSLSVNFTNSAYATTSIVSTATNNFGIECWVKPTQTSSIQIIAYNGSTGGVGDGGWGLIIGASNNYQALFGGLTAFGTNVATLNVWTHLALVQASGVSTLYINGVAAATNSGLPRGLSAGGFALAAPPQSPTSQFFTGSIDEVRVFTFAPGQFSTNDLLWSQPAVTTFPATVLSSTNAELNGTLNPNGVDSTAWFQYGTTTGYGNVTPTTLVSGTNSSAVSISNVIVGLSPGITYHFRLASSNATSSVFFGGDLAFSTPASAPGISGQSAGSISLTNAVLNALITANGADTTAWFQYGLTTNYGSSTSSTIISGTNLSAVPIASLVSQLSPGTIYHFQAVATNVAGTSYGGDQIFSTLAFAQSNALFPGLQLASVACGDFDNDGLMDVLLCGLSASGPITQVWRNTGNGFTNINAGLPGLYEGSVAWGDFDNDGRLDILLCGYNGSNSITQVWRNTGNGFTNINAGLPGVQNGSVAWGDFDNDGRLDILLCGKTDSGTPITQVWRNTGNGFTNINAGLPGLYVGSVAWGDFDNDGRLDILLSGANPNFITQVWRNTGNGFTNINAGLPGLTEGSVAWGDFDNDGRLDILLCGYDGSEQITQVWRNTGNGFTNINAGLPGVQNGSVAWGDFDNDGRLDILLCGVGISGTPITQVWRNTGNGFAKIQDLPGAEVAAAAWGDYNNDGRLDILISGYLSNGSLDTELWLNQTQPTNSPPTAPTGLSAALLGPSLILSWNASSDLQTPAPGLSYNLRVGTTPGGSDLLAPMADTNGTRLVPQRGNIQATQKTLQLPANAGMTVYWSVQSMDTSFAGSPFAPEASILLRPFFTSSGRRSDGTFEAQFDVLSGTNYIIQASTDLVHWENLFDFTDGSSGPFLFIDLDATNYPRRFYRFEQH